MLLICFIVLFFIFVVVTKRFVVVGQKIDFFLAAAERPRTDKVSRSH